MQLSSHFSLEEMTASQTASRKSIDNTPSPEIIENLTRLCAFLETVRDTLQSPMNISSGYRSPELNKAIGGVANSQHCQGLAADFTSSHYTLDGIIKLIISEQLPFDQLIKEFPDSSGRGWVHISIPNDPNDTPRQQVLIIDHTGTRPYTP